mgnify:CR=1 FL=1
MDAQGRVIDGDQIMAILALSLKNRGRLTDDTLVVTVMSNLGLKRAMADHGVRLIETKVGDRYVLEALAGHPVVAEAVAAAEAALGDSGRVLLRASGTEQMVRVMVEAADQVTAESVAARLADVVREQLAV